MSWVDGARTRLRLLFGRRAAEARMEEEFRFHLDMETERLMREEQLERSEARRRAVIAFGLAERHKDQLRDGRGLAWLTWLGGLGLDFRLGARMLVKYPGLTVIGGLAMAFAIWAGTVMFEFLSVLVSPSLPLPDGARIVQVRNWDVAADAAELRSAYDFRRWRSQLRTLTDIGAFRSVQRNLKGSAGETLPIDIAEITASGFRIAPTAPILGRTISSADEQPDAPPVLLIGYDVWKDRFASDSGVVGRRVQLGDRHATIIGVMPERFRFPIAHEAWMALPAELRDAPPREGPRITVFGRLAPGATLEQARAEVTVLGRRMSAERPRTHADLRPQVKPYHTIAFEPRPSDLGIAAMIYLFGIMLFVLICSNVAMLMFARAASRESELVVRSALGASRRRIVGQLFVEALVLGGAAAAVGLAGAGVALDRLGFEFLRRNFDRVPFWFDPKLSAPTVAYAILLTILAAVIAGALPALRLTRGLAAGLRQASPGAGGPQFSGVWTAVIVVQVALTVAFPGVVLLMRQELSRVHTSNQGFAADRYLGMTLDVDALSAPDLSDSVRRALRERTGPTLEALREQALMDADVAGVTFVDNLPGDWHPDALIEMDGTPGVTAAVSVAAVDPHYFETLEAPMLAGRAFLPGDFQVDARAVIVDRAFAELVTGGRSPIGRRLRFARENEGGEARWYEIVGVARELGMTAVVDRSRVAGLYLPVSPAFMQPIRMIVHARRSPATVAPRIRTIADSVDPTLRLTDVEPLSAIAEEATWGFTLWTRIGYALTGITLLLSLAGIYAVLSFTVARRTREIGVRVALGATPRRVITSVFRRPLTQVIAGIVVGTVIIAAGGRLEFGGKPIFEHGATGGGLVLLVPYMLLMLGICLLACIVPIRRALAVQPSIALRAE